MPFTKEDTEMDWNERSNKELAREWLLSFVPEDWWVRYLGFPAAEALFEKKLCSSRSVEYMTLLERDPVIFKELSKVVDADFQKVDVDTLEMNLDDYPNVDLTFHEYNLVWLDYCGPITPVRLSVLKEALRFIARDGIVAVTFMVGREKKSANTIIDFFDSTNDVEVDNPSEVPIHFIRRVRAIAEMVSGLPYNYRISVLPYADHVPMMCIVFEQTKKRSTVVVEPYLKRKIDNESERDSDT